MPARPDPDEEKRPAVGNPAFVNALAFDSSGSALACAKGDGSLELIERQSGKWERSRLCPTGISGSVEGHTWSATKVGFTSLDSEHRYLYSGGIDGRCIFWTLPAAGEDPSPRTILPIGRKVDSLVAFPLRKGDSGGAINLLVGGPRTDEAEKKDDQHGDILLFSAAVAI